MRTFYKYMHSRLSQIHNERRSCLQSMVYMFTIEDAIFAFEKLKHVLTSAPVLTCLDFLRRFFLQTDASTSGHVNAIP